MNTSPIFLLNFFKKVKTQIDGHFILKSKEKFQVFTSKPLTNIKCQKVSDTNIKGEPNPQYLACNVIKFDPTLHKLSQTKECHTYYNDHRKELDPFEKSLEKMSNNNE